MLDITAVIIVGGTVLCVKGIIIPWGLVKLFSDVSLKKLGVCFLMSLMSGTLIIKYVHLAVIARDFSVKCCCHLMFSHHVQVPAMLLSLPL